MVFFGLRNEFVNVQGNKKWQNVKNQGENLENFKKRTCKAKKNRSSEKTGNL